MEKWKDIEGYEGYYQISNHGRVMNVKRGSILRPGKNNRGYRRVLLCKDGVHTNKTVHRLVAAAFIPNPDGKPEVNHIDGNKENNCTINLEWLTHKENISHYHNYIHHNKRVDVLKRLAENALAEARAEEQERVAAIEARMREIEAKAAAAGISL